MSAGGHTTRKLVLGVVLMVVAGFLPALILLGFGGHDASSVATLAGLAVFMACLTGTGWRVGLVIAAPFALLVALTVWVAPNPWAAALVLGVAAFLRGYSAKAGLHNALMMTVISLGFLVASPPQFEVSMPAPIFAGIVALLASLWATLIIYVLRHRLHPHELQGLNPIRVLAYSLVLALLVAVATWFVVDLKLGHAGAWIILTVLVVFQPSLGAGFQKGAQRAAGTVLGFVIAIAIGVVLPGGPWLYVIGSVFLVAGFVVMLKGRAYWQFATLLTPAVVLLESGGSTVDKVAEQRLGATLIGVAGTLLVMLALSPFAKHFESNRQAT